MSNEDAALETVRSVLDESLGGLTLPIVREALSRRIVARLAEVQLIEEDTCCASCDGHSCEVR